VAHNSGNWTPWREWWSADARVGVVGETMRLRRRSGTRRHFRMMAGGDWEVLRRGCNGDKGARPSRGAGTLRGEAVHRLGDGSHNQQRNDV
jgi:hypothetical protein